jgi:sugar lactone lactonase YvrE
MRSRALLFAVLLAASPKAWAWNRGHAEIFAVLPAGSSGPEGIEVGADGKVYVTTFGFTSSGAASGEGQLFVFDAEGGLLRQVSIAGSSPHLLGLRFHPAGALLVIDFGRQQVLRVNPLTGSSRVFMTVPAGPMAGLNDLTFDKAGNVYVSDSFRGVIWKTGAAGGEGTAWVDDPLLRTTGIPPFGANGLRLDKSEANLFVANTGDDTVVRVPVNRDGTAGVPSVFTNSINGADGLIIDDQGNLWVAANQADEIVVVNAQGKVIAKLGDFGGIAGGLPIQMLFPASLRFHGEDLLVTNLALNTRLVGFLTVDTDWSAQVSRYTVVKIPARIPEVHGD